MGHTLTNPADAQARAAAEADLTLTLPGGVPMYFRRIPACPQGFLMGERGDRNAEPVHRVVIPRDFWLGTFPVTQAQYRAVAAAWGGGTLDADPSHFKGDLRPVERVSWDGATAWHALLRRHWAEVDPRASDDRPLYLEELGLPIEAQWEYACRGNYGDAQSLWSRTEHHTGDGEARLAEAAWFVSNSWRGTQDVGGNTPNGFGLHDMHGNVSDWCVDVWDGSAYRKREDGWGARAWTLEDAGEDARCWGQPRKPDQAPDRSDRVARGGSGYDTADRCRSAFRLGRGPVYRDWDQGFRVCLVRGSSEPPQGWNPQGAEVGPDLMAPASPRKGPCEHSGEWRPRRGLGPTQALGGVSDGQG